MTTGTGATSAFLAAQAMYSPSDASSAAEGEAQVQIGGDERGTGTTGMSDADERAYKAGQAMCAWYSLFKQTGQRAALNLAHHYCRVLRQMQEGMTQ